MTDTARALGAVGVSADAERVYRILLARPGSTTTELREATGLSARHLHNAMSELERKAIVTRRSGRPTRFQPAPPDSVVEALVSAQLEAIHRTRMVTSELLALQRLRPEQLEVTELVEIITSGEATNERWVQLQQTTRVSGEVLVRLPHWGLPQAEQEQGQTVAHTRGIVMRAVYDQDTLSRPGMLDHVRRLNATGAEESRVVGHLPLKLALIDRSTALVPLIQDNTIKGGVVVHQSVLVDALVALFESYWIAGTPITLTDEPTSSGRPVDQDVLTLLASGMKDEAIARTLGVSTQTVLRRVNDIKKRLGVSTRFQLGLALSAGELVTGKRRSDRS